MFTFFNGIVLRETNPRLHTLYNNVITQAIQIIKLRTIQWLEFSSIHHNDTVTSCVGWKVDYKIIQLCRCWSLELSVIIQSKHGQVNGPLRRRPGPGTELFHYHRNNNPGHQGCDPRVGETRPHIVTSSSGARRGDKTWRLGVTGHSSFRRHLRGRHERDQG